MQKCVPNIVPNVFLSIKIFNLMSRTRNTEWHKTYKCKCRLDASVCNNKQCQNEDECECDKLCYVGEYLDYWNLVYIYIIYI